MHNLRKLKMKHEKFTNISRQDSVKRIFLGPYDLKDSIVIIPFQCLILLYIIRFCINTELNLFFNSTDFISIINSIYSYNSTIYRLDI